MTEEINPVVTAETELLESMYQKLSDSIMGYDRLYDSRTG